MTTIDHFQWNEYQIYYRFINNQTDEPVIVFLNGLTDSLDAWNEIIQNLPMQNSYLCIDLLGQGYTLDHQLKNEIKHYNFTVEQQCQVLSDTLTKLNITKPIILTGFSYGGGIAIKWAAENPHMIAKLILLLPYIIRLDRAFPAARFWWNQLENLKQSTGFLGRQAQMFDRVYDNFIHHYMHYRYSNHVPEEHLRTAAIELSNEIMKLNVFDYLHLLPSKVTYLITSSRDTLVPNTLYRELWDKLPATTKQAWVQVSNGEHLILQQAPLLVARWLQKIIETHDYSGIEVDVV